MIRSIAISAALLIGLASGPVLAAGEATGHVENVDFSFDGLFGSYDPNQLQRGLKVYTEVCAACHGLKYVPYRALGDLGYSEDQVAEYAGRFETFDEDLEDFRPAKPTDYFPESAVENAPDLSLMAKARAGFHGPYGTGINQLFKGTGGPEYIVALLRGYTGKEKEEAGAVLYENTVFPGGYTAMAQPLYGGDVDFDDGHANDLAHTAEDVAAFLMWTAEPHLNERKWSGFLGVLILGLLAVLLYLTNKALWAPIKHGRRDKA